MMANEIMINETNSWKVDLFYTVKENEEINLQKNNLNINTMLVEREGFSAIGGCTSGAESLIHIGSFRSVDFISEQDLRKFS